MWFCVISVPPPRLAPAARMVCAPAEVAEVKGQESWADGPGGAWIVFPREQTRGSCSEDSLPLVTKAGAPCRAWC